MGAALFGQEPGGDAGGEIARVEGAIRHVEPEELAFFGARTMHDRAGPVAAVEEVDRHIAADHLGKAIVAAGLEMDDAIGA